MLLNVLKNARLKAPINRSPRIKAPKSPGKEQVKASHLENLVSARAIHKQQRVVTELSRIELVNSLTIQPEVKISLNPPKLSDNKKRRGRSVVNKEKKNGIKQDDIVGF